MSDDEIVRLITSECEADVRLGMERLVEMYGNRMETAIRHHSQALDPQTREDIRQDCAAQIGCEVKRQLQARREALGLY